LFSLCSLSALLFFGVVSFCSYYLWLYFHSFPTRRSSDLAVFGMATKYAEAVLAVKYRVQDARGEMAGGPMYYIERGMKQKWLAVDRKSTRLNSSHVSISYAVFCLKKKNIIISC